MTNGNAHTSEECTHSPNDIEQVGEVEDVPFYGGKANEERTHFICRLCGAKWVRLIESGLGGHGRFWERERE